MRTSATTHPSRSRLLDGRRLLAAALAAGLLSATVALAPPSAAATTTSKSARKPSGCLPAGDRAADTKGPYAVGERTVTFVDSSRPTAADPARGLPAHPDRTLVTTLLYPAEGSAATAALVQGATPAAGRFPIVEFSHGVTANGPVYAAVLAAWVRAGYVVAAPTFPLTSGPGASIVDEVNQPADVSFLLTSLIALGHEPSDPLFGHLIDDCLAIAGHSLGAVTTLDTAYDSCCVEPRISAAISLSGLLLPINHGNFTDPPKTPLLLVHGDADTTVPIAFSQQAFAQLPVPRWFVTMNGAGHVSIFVPPWGELTNEAAVAFLNLELKGSQVKMNLFVRAVKASGVATLQRAR